MKKALASIALLFALAPAASADPLNMKLNQTVTVNLSTAPSSIIVGNPDIASAKLQDTGTLLITGKLSGETNIVVLDKTGRTIWKSIIAVRSGQSGIKLRPA